MIDCESALDHALAALRVCDPDVIGRLHAEGGRPPLRLREPGFEGLAWIVVSQQVSTASANAIFARVRACVAPFEAETLARATDADLRLCGLSAPKIRTLRALAEAVLAGTLDLARLAGMPAEAAHVALTSVKGIGPWTADIFLLFCLGHPDAWPAGDLALQEAARLVLGLEARPDAKGLLAVGERWRPWRGVAARLLWAYYGAAKQGRAGMSLTTAL